jgi:hypothetical protein
MLGHIKRLTLLLLSISFATCDAQASAGPVFGKIEGRVSLSPSKPVCRADEPCVGAYAQAKVAVRSESGDFIVHATADEQGAFLFKVPAGTFVVSVEVDSPLMRCAQARVVVTTAATVRADIDCDTGLR